MNDLAMLRGAPDFRAGTVASRAGGVVGYEVTGSGPALVVAHGGAQAAIHYRGLARGLADRFTVVLYDRRGRGRTSPPPEHDGLDVEVADLAAVLAATGARFLFGHSAGAVIALEAALSLPVERVAVFEPPLDAVPLGWLPELERALADGRPGRAFAVFSRGLQMGPPGWLPLPVTAALARLFMRTAAPEMPALLATLPRDARNCAGRAAGRYASLPMPVLVAGGTKSPAYLQDALAALAAVVPHATRVDIPGADHTCPLQERPRLLVDALARFFAA